MDTCPEASRPVRASSEGLRARDRKAHGLHPVEMRDAPSGCGDCPIRRDGFCASLGDEVEAFAANAIRVDLPADRVVASADGPAGPCGVLVSGILRTVRYGYDGRRQVMNLIFPGELVSDQNVPDGMTLETATAVRLCRINRTSGARLAASSSRFRRLAYLQAARELERLRCLTLSLGALTPEERIASFLVAAVDVMPWQPLPAGGGVLTLTLSRTDIADLLGTSLESISRITHRFHQSGLIRIRDPRHLEIPDPARLAEVGTIDAGTWAFSDPPAGGGDPRGAAG